MWRGEADGCGAVCGADCALERAEGTECDWRDGEEGGELYGEEALDD